MLTPKQEILLEEFTEQLKRERDALFMEHQKIVLNHVCRFMLALERLGDIKDEPAQFTAGRLYQRMPVEWFEPKVFYLIVRAYRRAKRAVEKAGWPQYTIPQGYAPCGWVRERVNLSKV